MKFIAYLAITTATALFSVAPAQAWSLKGYVRCPTGRGYPNVGIEVTGKSCDGIFQMSIVTDSDGNYVIGLPDCAGSFNACILTATLPPGSTLVSPECQDFSTDDNNQDADVVWVVDGPFCQNSCPPCFNSFNSTGTVASGFVTLGSAKSYGVLGLVNTQINNSNVTITGNVGISQGGKLTNMAPSTITGNVVEFASGQYSGPGHLHGSISVDPGTITMNDADAVSASAAAAALVPTRTFGSINNLTTVVGNGGLNVIKVNGDIKGSFILQGGSDDVFVVNVTGTVTFGGSSVLGVAGGVTPSHVLYNFTGASGTIASHVGNIFYGTLLAPKYSFDLDGVFNGEIIGGGKSIVLKSGAKVNNMCPPCH